MENSINSAEANEIFLSVEILLDRLLPENRLLRLQFSLLSEITNPDQKLLIINCFLEKIKSLAKSKRG